ncbi:MAG: DNA-directed RNA polymerase subunit L [Archaeoglobaceae archaeon]|nr:DNA-directed RNA polymerase subunit L [Archaeoglobaceae archaeon]MCX8152530.1 DNA-directed RNA polymerase subunit L [Archaeoglobaceae archaeon]MDW8014049.1 DNA-directed RNA polymerase subunit L [Archaeoglobaceae archaeon]
MELKITEIGKDFVRIVIKGEDHTFLNLLQHYLAEDEHVIFVRYNIPHPLIEEAELFVKTDGDEPIKAILRANEKIEKDCSKLMSLL